MFFHKSQIRWVCFVFLVLIPALFMPYLINDFKIQKLIQENNICDSLTFYYDNDRTVSIFNSDSCYVLLPSFTNLDEIRVESTVDYVTFSSKDNDFTVTKETPILCQFEPDTIYDVSFYKRNGRLLATDTIVFLKSDKLPTIYINTQSGTMDKLDEDKTNSEPGTYELVDTEGNILFSDTLTEISARGNQTFSFPKKSYQIDTAHPVDFLNMGESDTWILLSNVTDSSYIRNKLTYDMALYAGMEGSPKSEYVDVYFNNSYGGMYLLTEKIEISKNRLEYYNLDEANKEANHGNDNKFKPYISDDRHQKAYILPNNPQDITGSYLIEHDYGDKYDTIKSGFITKLEEPFSIKSPKYASKEQIEYISSLMQEIEDSLIAPDGINPTTGKHFTEYIDLDSWADKYLVEEISRNNGGGATSSYFYKPPDNISSKVYGGPVWDYDKAYGNYYQFNLNTRDLGFLTLHSFYTNWFFYLYQHDDFLYTVKSNYENKFSDYLETMANEKIQEYTSLISASAKLDSTRFHYLYAYYDFVDTPLDHENIADSIRNFILERKEFLDQVWIDNKEIVYVHFRLSDFENGNRTAGLIKGESLQRFPSDTGISYWKNEKTGAKVSLNTPITEEITLVPVFE